MNQELYNTIVIERSHRAGRKMAAAMAETFAAEGLEPKARMTKRFELLCQQEQPRFLPGERIAFLRTTKNIPDCFTEEEWKTIRSQYYIHESGYQSNLTIDYAKVLKNGILSLKSVDEYTCRSIDALLELVEEFFLSLNRDSDLYPGVQQGDNGQSLMLGGRTRTGESGFNKLSELCLTASRNLKLIDPKINIRVDKDTPEEVYTLCSELTKVGLGFPQYSNDDVVIPGLIRLGYTPEDAVEYSVAACWEFIVPGCAKDVPNIAVLSFPKVIDTCLHRDLPGCSTMAEFYDCIKKEIKAHCEETAKQVDKLWFVPSPILDVCMNDIQYRNYGMHGVGLSTAAETE